MDDEAKGKTLDSLSLSLLAIKVIYLELKSEVMLLLGRSLHQRKGHDQHFTQKIKTWADSFEIVDWVIGDTAHSKTCMVLFAGAYTSPKMKV